MVFVFLPVDQFYQFIFSEKVRHYGSVRSPLVSVPKCLCVVTRVQTAEGWGAAWTARAEAGHWGCSGADRECRHSLSRFFISLLEWGDVHWVTSGPSGGFERDGGVRPPSDKESGLHARCNWLVVVTQLRVRDPQRGEISWWAPALTLPTTQPWVWCARARQGWRQ